MLKPKYAILGVSFRNTDPYRGNWKLLGGLEVFFLRFIVTCHIQVNGRMPNIILTSTFEGRVGKIRQECIDNDALSWVADQELS